MKKVNLALSKQHVNLASLMMSATHSFLWTMRKYKGKL